MIGFEKKWAKGLPFHLFHFIAMPANDDWDVLMEEDFKTGYGLFQSSRWQATHYKSVKDRDGVIRIKEDSVIYFNKIILDATYSSFMIDFAMYVLQIQDGDNFCLDCSVDGWLAHNNLVKKYRD